MHRHPAFLLPFLCSEECSKTNKDGQALRTPGGPEPLPRPRPRGGREAPILLVPLLPLNGCSSRGHPEHMVKTKVVAQEDNLCLQSPQGSDLPS